MIGRFFSALAARDRVNMHQNLPKVGHKINTNNSHDTHIHIKFTHVPDDKMGVNTTHDTLIRRA